MTDQQESLCPNGEKNCPIFEEIRDLRKKIDTLSTQVRTDFLTGLYNRQHLFFSLEQELERTQRSLQPTTLILIDIDHFKHINDNYGHVTGDKVLAHLGQLIKNTVRKIDIPCRYGGEEFAVILPATATLVGVQVAERLRNNVSEQALSVNEKDSLSMTISIGVDTINYSSILQPDAFIARVDKWLYKAKEEGRNRVCSGSHKIDDTSTVSSEEKEALFKSFD